MLVANIIIEKPPKYQRRLGLPGAIARSVAMSLGNQEEPQFFCKNLVNKTFRWPFLLFR